MANDSDQDPEPEWLRNLPLRSEEIGFSSGELIECKGCGKPNAPNRVSCLYCGTAIGDVKIAESDIREPESWENGFNVIVIDASGGDVNRAAAALGLLLGCEREFLRSILTAEKIVPLARVGSESQASIVSDKLAELGIKTTVVSDESLMPASPPTRLRWLILAGDELKLELFNLGEVRSLKRDELALIVPGVILEGRTESIAKRKRKETKTLHETETSSDEPVIDIYSKDDPTGWRIPASGFDFSGLGRDKTLLVAENMKTLTSKLVEFAPAARLVDDYVNVRSFLEYSWPSESRKDSLGLSLGRKELSTVFSTNNTLQMTKYSRLQWRLYEKEV